MSEIFNIKTVTQLHSLLEIEKPLHPLISIVRHSKSMRLDYGDARFSSDLYFISLKENLKGSFVYGRNEYDYDGGSLVFVAPGQIMSSTGEVEPDLKGWSIFFHPDLINRSVLASTISTYHFFDYDIHEALHLSDKEKQSLTECVFKIEQEINQEMDNHSQELIVHNIETILKYALRYYERQFNTRSNQSKDHVIKFEKYLKDYFSDSQQLKHGMPSVEVCGKAMNMSGKYLSDLLKAETGKSLIEHVHLEIIKHAKTSLLNSSLSISEIAYSLGFVYPQHFSKLFKTKTGYSPKAFRNLN